ncbi:MAG TPA: beta-ketoacyl synthase N-terminal-like domain-containing protein, partial [Puia sp.]
MRNADVFIASDNIYSPLGVTTAVNFSELTKGISGIRQHDDPAMSAQPFYAALFEKRDGFMKDDSRTSGAYTRFEELLMASIADALRNSGIDPADKKTVLILSSTKGNISLLETAVNESPAGSRRDLAGPVPEPLKERIALHTSARLLAEYFGFSNPPIVASNACISGIMAILTGFRLIRSGQYENAVIAGADVISNFVLSGFQSFQAISSRPCR